MGNKERKSGGNVSEIELKLQYIHISTPVLHTYVCMLFKQTLSLFTLFGLCPYI